MGKIVPSQIDPQIDDRGEEDEQLVALHKFP
jgi:hypothetical protein